MMHILNRRPARRIVMIVFVAACSQIVGASSQVEPMGKAVTNPLVSSATMRADDLLGLILTEHCVMETPPYAEGDWNTERWGEGSNAVGVGSATVDPETGTAWSQSAAWGWPEEWVVVMTHAFVHGKAWFHGAQQAVKFVVEAKATATFSTWAASAEDDTSWGNSWDQLHLSVWRFDSATGQLTEYGGRSMALQVSRLGHVDTNPAVGAATMNVTMEPGYAYSGFLQVFSGATAGGASGYAGSEASDVKFEYIRWCLAP